LAIRRQVTKLRSSEERERNGFKSENFFAKLGWEKDSRNSFILRSGYYHEDLSSRDEEKFDLGLTGKIGVSDTADIVVKGYGVQSSDESHIGGSKEATISDGNKYRGEVQCSGKFGGKHTFTLGTEALYETLEQRLEKENPDIDKVQRLESFYVQDEAALEKFSLLGAARLDHHSVWGSHFSPKAALLYRATDWLSVRLGGGGAFKAPTFQRLYRKSFHGGGEGFWILGSTDLKPETSIGSNLDIMFRCRDILNARMGLFRHDLENMIHGYMVYPDPEDEKNRHYTYRNIGKAMSQGMETEVKTKPFWGFSTAVKYSYLNTKDKEMDKELTYTPHHKVKAELSYFNRTLGSSIILIREYVGTRFQDTENEEELPAYSLTNIRINQSIKDYVCLFLTIDNIFGAEYKDVRFSEDSRTYKMGLRLKI
jgi:outer membrane receptor for ferrienterochelin and colicins